MGVRRAQQRVQIPAGPERLWAGTLVRSDSGFRSLSSLCKCKAKQGTIQRRPKRKRRPPTQNVLPERLCYPPALFSQELRSRDKTLRASSLSCRFGRFAAWSAILDFAKYPAKRSPLKLPRTFSKVAGCALVASHDLAVAAPFAFCGGGHHILHLKSAAKPE